MKAKKKHDALLAETPKAQPAENSDEKEASSLSRIQQRAYDLWEARGCDTGRELEDWLQAEAELKATFD